MVPYTLQILIMYGTYMKVDFLKNEPERNNLHPCFYISFPFKPDNKYDISPVRSSRCWHCAEGHTASFWSCEAGVMVCAMQEWDFILESRKGSCPASHHCEKWQINGQLQAPTAASQQRSMRCNYEFEHEEIGRPFIHKYSNDLQLKIGIGGMLHHYTYIV